jgi:hypothetical protein
MQCYENKQCNTSSDILLNGCKTRSLEQREEYKSVWEQGDEADLEGLSVRR